VRSDWTPETGQTSSGPWSDEVRCRSIRGSDFNADFVISTSDPFSDLKVEARYSGLTQV
jgi:hypothetical protein